MPLTTNNSALIVPPKSTAATNDIRGIKPPVVIPNSWAWAYWMGGILLGVTAAVVAFIWLRKKFAQPKPVVVVPPHVRAKAKLREALLLISDPRAFCIAVSDALRVYLEERFSFRAPERTTEEFLQDLQATILLSVEQKQSLSDFLQECDLVKFARFEPIEEELRRLHDAALRLVDETQYEQIRASGSSGASNEDTSPRPSPQSGEGEEASPVPSELQTK